MMRYWLLILMSVTLFFVSGCAILDGAFGIDPEAGTDSRGPAESAAPLVDLLLPGGGALIGLVGAIYGSFRNRKANRYRKAGKALVPALDLVLEKLERGDSSLSREEVVALLVDMKRRYDVEQEINELRGK